MTEREKILLIQKITKEMMEHSVKDQKGKHISEHEKAVELLARALHDFSELYLKQQNDDEVLKGILAKVKIAYNTMERVKKPNIVIKRV